MLKKGRANLAPQMTAAFFGGQIAWNVISDQKIRLGNEVV
jgi:hypothetical protein